MIGYVHYVVQVKRILLILVDFDWRDKCSNHFVIFLRNQELMVLTILDKNVCQNLLFLTV